MVWQLYQYRLRRLLNDKVELFWLAVFPIVLGTFFHMAFSEISSKTEHLDRMPVAIVEQADYPAKAELDAFLDAMAGEGGMLTLLPAQDYEEAKKMLQEGEAAGIILVSQNISLEFLENGMEQTILKYIVDCYLQRELVLMEAGKRGQESFLAAAAAFTEDATQNRELPVSEGEMDTYIQYFFALMAMSCMYASSLGLLNTQEIQADQTKVALRRCISPVKKGRAVVTDILAAFTVQSGIFLVLYGYLKFVLKIHFGDNFGLILLAGVASILNGISYGYLLGVSIKAKNMVKNAILTGSILALSFLAGLMVGGMKFAIEKNIPLINRINPVALSSDCFYYICVFGNKDRYVFCILILLAETLLFGGIAALILKKERYKSI